MMEEATVLGKPVVLGKPMAMFDPTGVDAWTQGVGVGLDVVYGDPAIVDKWRVVDADDDQQVTASVFRFAYMLPPEPFAAILGVADAHGDGLLGYLEFRDFVWPVRFCGLVMLTRGLVSVLMGQVL